MNIANIDIISIILVIILIFILLKKILIKKKYKTFCKSMNIISVILFIILIFILLKKKNYETFYNSIDDDFDDSILNNKTVDIVCSGPSSQNVKLKSDIVICPNSSILNKSINIKNLDKTVIWLYGPSYRLYDIINKFDEHPFVTDYLNNIKVIPDYLLIEYVGDKTLDKYNHLKKQINIRYPKIKVCKIRKTLNCSTGTACLFIALNGKSKKIYVSGYMDWLGKEYSYNSEYNNIPSISRNFAKNEKYISKNKIHSDGDIKYLNDICLEDKKKIITSNKELKECLNSVDLKCYNKYI